MNYKDINAKNKIIEVTMEILSEADDPEKITIRQIAERAGVGVGLINYHFDSKDNLLYKAVANTMEQMAKKLQHPKDNETKSPIEKLKIMLKELVDLAMHYSKLSLILVSHEMQQGNMSAPLYLLPILKEIYGETKNEIEIRIIALEIIATLQISYMGSHGFKVYSGIDIQDEIQRDKLIDILIENTINK